MASTPTAQPRITEAQKTKRRMRDSPPCQLVAATATTMDEMQIILPITPPVELEPAISTDEMPSWPEVTICNPPNSAFAAVSEPVAATPSQPSMVPKKG